MSTSSPLSPQPLIHQPVLTSLPTIQVPERVSSAPVPSSSQPVWSPFNGPGFHTDAVPISMTMHPSLDYRTHAGFADFALRARMWHPQTAADVPAGRVDLGGRGLEIPQPGAAGVNQWYVQPDQVSACSLPSLSSCEENILYTRESIYCYVAAIDFD
jgi:hypothetical protein